jgi:hypothetical protein
MKSERNEDIDKEKDETPALSEIKNGAALDFKTTQIT